MLKALAAGILTASLALSTAFALDYVVAAPAGQSADAIAERVDGAFAVASEVVTQVLVYREAAPTSCGDAVWPHIDPSCLVSTNGSAPSSVRVIY